jgi:hypothetical protein
MTAARIIRASNFTLQRTNGLALLALRPLSVAFAALAKDPACRGQQTPIMLALQAEDVKD